jgi:hypothetical protein
MRIDSPIRALVLVVMLGALVATVGCGASGTIVTGQVASGGKPYTINEEKEELQVTFVTGEGEEMKGYPANVQPDGTFSVVGPHGRGIPPGKYRIIVQSIPYGGDQSNAVAMPEDEDDIQADKFRGKFSAEKTPLTIEIGAEETAALIIDLKKGTVSR